MIQNRLNCPNCKKKKFKKNWTSNQWVQRYFCNICKKTFSDSKVSWYTKKFKIEVVQHSMQNYNEIYYTAKKYGLSRRTVKLWREDYLKNTWNY